ncbi:MAG TPA: hypothetical protein VMF67_13995 [Rhizomicrobium sp.]|nr:hypothetical protein [Rhizomicrobium sp.]
MNVALIGSFKQHYEEVLAVGETLIAAGHRIVSPALSDISVQAAFVRFTTDHASDSDPEVQSKTLRNIFGADCVYVVNPNGYVGRTTCYEIGRIIQRRQPLYFLAIPVDLPVGIPPWAVCSPDDFAQRLHLDSICWLYSDERDAFAIERGLR